MKLSSAVRSASDAEDGIMACLCEIRLDYIAMKCGGTRTGARA